MAKQPGFHYPKWDNWINKTAERRLVIWSVGFWLVSIVILGFIFSLVGQRQILNETRQRNIQFASAISKDINAEISMTIGNTRTFAQYLTTLKPDLETQAGALLGLRLSSIKYRGLYYLEANDKILLNLTDTTQSLLAIKDPTELVNRPVTPAKPEITEIFTAVEKSGTAISKVYYTPLDYVPVIDIGMPVVFVTGEKRVIVFEVDLSDIWQKIDMATFGRTGITYAVSQDDKVIAHPEPALIGRPIPSELAPVLKNYEGSALFMDPLTGRDAIAAFSPVGGQTGWGVVVQQDLEEINAYLVNTATTIIVVLLILGISGTFIIWLLVRGFTRPIKEFTVTTRDIARTGNLTKIEMKPRVDEVGQLSRAFNQMIDKIKNTESKLFISQERYHALFEHANDAILLINKIGIIDCNHKAEEMFEASREQIIGKLPSELSPESQPDGTLSRVKEQRLLDQAFTGVEQRFEWKHQTFTGRLFYAEVCLNQHSFDNQPFLMSIIRDITDRKEAEEALKQAQKAKEEAAAAERTRLAHDLHDAVSQTLFSANLIADVLPRIWDKNQAEGRRRLEEIKQLTRGALAEMRTLLFELRPAALADAELSYLLHQLAESIKGRSRIPVEVLIEGECELQPEIKVALYRITQEALNNVAKHAGATQALVNVNCKEEEITLTISDNGKGFNISGVHPESLGLGIMRERAGGIGAEVMIDSKIGVGTRVIVKVKRSPPEV